MLQLSPSRTKAGLAARDVLVGCVAENDARALGQALRLVQSIRWFGGEMAGAQVLVCVVGEPGQRFRQAFERYGAEVRIVPPFHQRNRTADKLQFFQEAWETDREMLLLLDCDTVVVQDPLPWMRRGSFQARIAPLPTVTAEVFERVFRHFGVPLPAREHVHSFTGTPTILSCNSGVLLLPAEMARQIVPVWSDYNARLASEIEILHPCERQCHQASLSLALAACPVPFVEAPAELDFQLNLSHLQPPEGYFTIDPAILRYDDRVDAEGFLLHSPYPFAQVRIEAFNRRLLQEREGLAGAAESLLRAREKPVPEAGPPTQVVVLGMHRSGTSALTALLQRMGLWAGEEADFPPADDHNETGYWEHRGIWSIDEAILQTLGASWSEVADLDLSRLDEGSGAVLRERACEVVRDLDRHGSWVIKDPRLCVLFPFWREVLERPFCVLLYREPLPVARSLAARDGFSLPHGIALWEKYTLEALASTRGLPRVLISHRELLTDPVPTLRRLHQDLVRHSPELARLPVPTADEIRDILNPDLVHHAHDPEAERAYLTPPQLALLNALADGSALGLDPVPPLSAGARDLLASHRIQQSTTRTLRNLLTAQTHTAASLQQAQDGLLAAHHRASEAHLRTSAAHHRTSEAHQRALAWIDELDALVTAIFESRSWKIGRAITTTLGRLLGRSGISASERHERLKSEIQRWRRGLPGD